MQETMSERIVYLMRGLPCCGKSHTARQLAGIAAASVSMARSSLNGQT